MKVDFKLPFLQPWSKIYKIWFDQTSSSKILATLTLLKNSLIQFKISRKIDSVTESSTQYHYTKDTLSN